MTTADEMSDLDSQHSRQSSTYKMSIDSDDLLRDMAVSNWANSVERNNVREEEPRRTRRDPERRSVNRRSSLLVSCAATCSLKKSLINGFSCSQNQKRF